MQQSSDFYKGYNKKGYNLYNNNSTFISSIYTFPWRETYLFTRQIKVQIGKSTLIILSIKEKMPTLPRNKDPSPISSLMHRVFSIFRREKYRSNPSKMDIKVVNPAPTQ